MIIKIANLGFLFLLASIVLSCDKGEVGRKFSIRLDRNFEVPAGLDYLNAHYFVLDEIPTFYQQVVNQQNVPAGTKITLVPESAVISSIYNDVDFDFVDKVSVRISIPIPM
jgi:hypothetical protein